MARGVWGVSLTTSFSALQARSPVGTPGMKPNMEGFIGKENKKDTIEKLRIKRSKSKETSQKISAVD